MDLSRSTVDQCLLILRKLDWNNAELVAKVSKLFREVWEFKFSQLDFLAFLTAELSEYHPEFSIGVVDAVLEDIWRGLQTNIFGNNQKRVAQVKFLGELYNFKMFDHTIIFDTLYLILTFGYEHGMLHPDSESPFDGKKDYFRIRLCSMLLETSGAFFKNGRTGRKLDRFLAFFQVNTSFNLQSST